VDVIVSEWMGYALLFETMLDTVLAARDRWLAPGGAVLPDTATIHLAAAGERATGLDFWADVYGFSMAPLGAQAREAARGRALVREVAAADLLSAPFTAKALDMCAMAPEEQDFSVEFELPALPGAAPAACHALVLWFDTAFSGRHCAAHPVVLSTSPAAPPTHWAQTVLVLPAPVLLAAGDGGGGGDAPLGSAPALTGRLSMSRSRGTHRALDISVEVAARLRSGEAVRQVQSYVMQVDS